uniref:Uncharacterized protein n=1 Tax=Peronospora matthiolae TaxID=2874970 RepID=A0AAV1TT47_9STRA
MDEEIASLEDEARHLTGRVEKLCGRETAETACSLQLAELLR